MRIKHDEYFLFLVKIHCHHHIWDEPYKKTYVAKAFKALEKQPDEDTYIFIATGSGNVNDGVRTIFRDNALFCAR